MAPVSGASSASGASEWRHGQVLHVFMRLFRGVVESAKLWRMLADGPYLNSSDIANFRIQYWGVRQRVKEGQSNALLLAPLAPFQFHFAKISPCSNFLNIGS